jgi:hypothetical protein
VYELRESCKRKKTKSCGKKKKNRRSESSEAEDAEDADPVSCRGVSATLAFSGSINNQESCKALFLNTGYIGAVLGEDLNLPVPGTENEITSGRGFEYTQVVPVDSNCATLTYHIEKCRLRDCERYVLTIAKVNQCGKGCDPDRDRLMFDVAPLVNIPLDTSQGEDLCGRASATYANLTGAVTVVAKLEAGDLIACYFTILPSVNECEAEECIPCVAKTGQKDENKEYKGCGAILVSINLS